MKAPFLVLALALTSLPLAAASHGCTPTSTSQAIGTVTVTDAGMSCHYSYVGTGYFSDETYAYRQLSVEESTTGAELHVRESSNEGVFGSSAGLTESTGDAWTVGLRTDLVEVGAGVFEDQTDQPTACWGQLGVGSSYYAPGIGSGGASQYVYRGSSAVVPCPPVAPGTLLP